ncbi:MAG: magnesium/cobalt transporter CorA [Gemmatimonadota bacterium]|nr:MAG: magnesium/cobalt transporter CorA [Gemmatimonadota bacterium]
MKIRHVTRSKRRPRISPKTAPGSSPGTLVVDPSAKQSVVQVTAYSEQDVIETTLDDPQSVREYLDKWSVVWINVDGLGNANTIAAIGEIFRLHPLALEDVVNANQRPKVEEFQDHAFIVARMPHLEEVFHGEQISLFLGANWVITFQEHSGDCFDPIRKRIRARRQLLLGADYLAYALLDAIVDSYFPILETFGERLEGLEDEIAGRPNADVLTRIHYIRHDLLALRRTVWPMRDVLNELVRDAPSAFSGGTRTYLRDCYDHTVRIIDIVETYRDLGTGLTEFYQSTVSQRMNEIMKVLTIIATIFIPITFIAGVYGMNFNTELSPWNMPELNLYLGYPIALLSMAAVALAMIFYFRRKRWLGV